MKSTVSIILLVAISHIALAQENLAVNSFRKVPADELKTFMQNEAFYWSKVAAVLKEKGQITAWGVQIRSGGMLASEPNVNTRIGVGSWENFENLGRNYAAAEEFVRSQMDPEMLALLEETLKQDKFEFASILTNTQELIWSDKQPSFNYVVYNYSRADNPSQYLAEETRIMKPFFEKLMKQGKTKMKGWGTVNVLSPNGYEYPYNAFTVDFYENIGDAFSPFTSEDVSWPEEMASLGDLKTPGFWKRVIWKRVLHLNQKNELVQSW
ncbi:MAG: hypothetical protein ACO3RO_02335 [Flavobacteriaceae bacterium]